MWDNQSPMGICESLYKGFSAADDATFIQALHTFSFVRDRSIFFG
jgi:hypothetical protein